MFKTLKEVYDSKIFHGVKTEAEAYELCKEESENHGKEHVLIWFLKEKDGKLSEKVIGYCRDSENPYPSFWLANYYFKGFQSRSLKKFPCGYIPGHSLLSLIRSNPMDFVLNKNPHQLCVLARAEVLDNFKYCCLKNLIERIDELQIPVKQKEELKKLVRPFQWLLTKKIPKLFSDSESEESESDESDNEYLM